MTSACTRHGQATTTVHSGQTVGDVAARSPRVLEALQRLGIDHCCGAALTLAEAAAAAGVSTDALLEAVNLALGEPVEPRTTSGGPRPAARATLRPVPLDVRGLEPPQPMVRVLERLQTLGADEELLMIHDRRPMLLYPQLDARGFLHETSEVAPGVFEIRIRHAAGPDAPPGPSR